MIVALYSLVATLLDSGLDSPFLQSPPYEIRTEDGELELKVMAVGKLNGEQLYFWHPSGRRFNEDELAVSLQKLGLSPPQAQVFLPIGNRCRFYVLAARWSSKYSVRHVKVRSFFTQPGVFDSVSDYGQRATEHLFGQVVLRDQKLGRLDFEILLRSKNNVEIPHIPGSRGKLGDYTIIFEGLGTSDRYGSLCASFWVRGPKNEWASVNAYGTKAQQMVGRAWETIYIDGDRGARLSGDIRREFSGEETWKVFVSPVRRASIGGLALEPR